MFAIWILAGCNTWQFADYTKPTGRYNRNLSDGWLEAGVPGNPVVQQAEAEEVIPRYVDLYLYNRKFRMVYYKEGHDSIVEFDQKGMWYMERQNDSMFVILNYRKLKNNDRLSFSDNAERGHYDALIAYPSGAIYQKCERLF